MKFLSTFILASIFLFASCDSTTSEKVEEKMDTLANKVENAADNLGNRTDSMDKGDDADFVEDAVKLNNMELHMLAEGRTKGTNAELKSAAKKMEADHKKLAKKMSEYAAKKNITIDTADHHDMDDNDAKGAAWDKEWADDMVEDHEKAIKEFEEGQNEVQDAELKAIITETLPTLREHLESAKKLQAKLSNTK
jgi:putative membrane protein